ncbi:MAG: transglutaminase-like cysteine peptidase [Deltaproteobacteria bacterium]|nr:transglutaminase-like cysteine peptidase [Deltaproteobacteria bacterium]
MTAKLRRVGSYYREQRFVDMLARVSPTTISVSGNLAEMNATINKKFTFKNDIDVWSIKDYWAAPHEFAAKGEGDCDDFAIYKYFALKQIGFPFGKTYLGTCTYTQTGELHLVTLVGPQFMVMDNLIDEVLPAACRPDLLFNSAVNNEGLFLFRPGKQCVVPQ